MARKIGIILLVAAMCVVLAALIFPVFAQAKMAAKKTAALAARKRAEIAQEQSDGATAKTASLQVQTRSVIRKGELTIVVEKIDAGESGVKQIVQSVGGYVDSAQGFDLASSTPSMTITTRVPEQLFEQVLARYEKLGRRTEETISAEDVTEQIVDMDARMKTMLAQEEAYRGMLRHVASLSQSTQLQDELMHLREGIESIAAQRKSLAGLASMSTIAVTLEQKPDPVVGASVDPSWGSDAWAGAITSAMATFRGLGVAAIWLLAYSPLWLVAGAAAWWAVRSARKGSVA